MRPCRIAERASAPVSVLFSEPKIPQYENTPDRDSRVQRFQYSSASRKFLNGSSPRSAGCGWLSFSTLQRAENSSIILFGTQQAQKGQFQYSSASRKFLNRYDKPALENEVFVSVLFSEPKIPQLRRRMPDPLAGAVSVLFSEPKIPQCLNDS